MPRAAVFSYNGLGDGINFLVLSHHLHVNGFEVTTYHNTIGSMQNWFPHQPVQPYPSVEELPGILQKYDWYFVGWSDASEFVQKLILEGKQRFADRIKVLYLKPSPNVVREPYYADCLADPTVSVAENMRIVSERVMHLPKTSQGCGIIPPQGLVFRKHPKRIVIHPTSGRTSKNWPKNKFLKLALHMKKQGFSPVFVPGAKEMKNWLDVANVGFELADFATLDELAGFIYESGFVVGNDSGLAHLAAAVGIETLTFFGRIADARLWAPSFNRAVVLTPSPLIRNGRGLRLLDRHWHRFITTGMARRGFERLITPQR